jgi:hypothetical protein
MALLWKGRHIWGTIGLSDAELRAAYLKYFEGIAARYAIIRLR